MTALTKSITRNHNIHTPQLLPLPMAADTRVFGGAIVASNATGQAVPAADAAGLTIQGVAWKGFDNTGGAAGVFGSSTQMLDSERLAQVDQVGEWEFKVQGPAAPLPGGDAYVVDDNTVTADADLTSNGLKVGRFTRPGNEGGWFVDIERRW